MGGLGTVDEKGVFKADNSSTGVETVRAEFGGQVATTEIDVTLRAISLAIWPVLTTVQAGASIQFMPSVDFMTLVWLLSTKRSNGRFHQGCPQPLIVMDYCKRSPEPPETKR